MTRLSIEIQNLSDIKKLTGPQRDEIFTSGELFGSSELTLAGKMAAKKAFLKCLGMLSANNIPYNRIEVKRSSGRRPFIETSDTLLLKKFTGRKISISISHTKDIAIAVCILYNK
ncbi:MAG TPA: 4'-phosphopantetheinyl transferase superfamily protein [bacterium]|nr:4'-phosphopantetheinyl transferase superfamily protein [bacterium]